jgi:hypothetical protein
METKHILVLCDSLDYFNKWCNTICKWYQVTPDKRTGNTLRITTSNGVSEYRAFTPNMEKDVLLGLRFDEIIDQIGLSKNDKVWYNILKTKS